MSSSQKNLKRGSFTGGLSLNTQLVMTPTSEVTQAKIFIFLAHMFYYIFILYCINISNLFHFLSFIQAMYKDTNNYT